MNLPFSFPATIRGHVLRPLYHESRNIYIMDKLEFSLTFFRERENTSLLLL